MRCRTHITRTLKSNARDLQRCRNLFVDHVLDGRKHSRGEKCETTPDRVPWTTKISADAKTTTRFDCCRHDRNGWARSAGGRRRGAERTWSGGEFSVQVFRTDCRREIKRRRGENKTAHADRTRREDVIVIRSAKTTRRRRTRPDAPPRRPERTADVSERRPATDRTSSK